MLNDTPFSIAYCDLKSHVRVLSRAGDTPIPLRVGGMDVDNQMVLLLDGQRYDQGSPEIPLQDVPFEKTTWGKWKARHPETLVYGGDLKEHARF
jgi:hypothetical protein